MLSLKGTPPSDLPLSFALSQVFSRSIGGCIFEAPISIVRIPRPRHHISPGYACDRSPTRGIWQYPESGLRRGSVSYHAEYNSPRPEPQIRHSLHRTYTGLESLSTWGAKDPHSQRLFSITSRLEGVGSIPHFMTAQGKAQSLLRVAGGCRFPSDLTASRTMAAGIQCWNSSI